VAVLLIWRNRRELTISLSEIKSWWPRRGSLKLLITGLAISTITGIASLGLLVVYGNFDRTDASLSRIVEKLAAAILTAAVVSVLEECVFRGVLYKQLAARRGHWLALFFSSLVYAVVHFLTPVKSFQINTWTPFVGFDYLRVIISNLASPGIPAGLLGLCFVGAILCETVRRTRSLALAIGLHAGWILVLKMSLVVTSVTPGTVFAAGLGRRYFFVAEPITWIGLVLVWWIVVKSPLIKTQQTV